MTEKCEGDISLSVFVDNIQIPMFINTPESVDLRVSCDT